MVATCHVGTGNCPLRQQQMLLTAELAFHPCRDCLDCINRGRKTCPLGWYHSLSGILDGISDTGIEQQQQQQQQHTRLCFQMDVMLTFASSPFCLILQWWTGPLNEASQSQPFSPSVALITVTCKEMNTKAYSWLSTLRPHECFRRRGKGVWRKGHGGR